MLPAPDGPPISEIGVKNASGAPNTSDLVATPETWRWWTVESITSDVIDYRGRTPPNSTEGLIPHVRTTQIRNGRIDWNTDRFITEETYSAYMTRGTPRRGDMLFTMEAPLGEVGVVDRDERFSLAQRILLLRPTDGVDGEFLALMLRSQPFRHATELRATGSGVMGIAYKRFRSVEIPRPPLSEQQEIVRRVSRLMGAADQVVERLDAVSQRVGYTSQVVLAKAFRGDLTGVAV